MNKTAILGTGLLGLLGGLFVHAEDNGVAESQRALIELKNNRIASIDVDPLIGNTCYGRPCPINEINNCDDLVIEKNLKKLNGLNIIKVNELAPFACTGYCFSDTPEGQLQDKCEKAEALAKLVELASPLKVNIKN